MKTYFKNVFNCLFIIILFSSLSLSGCSDSSGEGGSSKIVEETTLWYADKDEDNFGDPETSQEAVSKPDGYVDNNSDCKDDDPLINPDAKEVLDNVDNNCDGETDEDFKSLWYEDKDGDGFGAPDISQKAISKPDGYVDNNFDCRDDDSSIHPQTKEVPGDGKDNNCNGEENEPVPDGILPDTGQTTPSTEIFGEDATYSINPRSYTKLGDKGEPLNEDADSWIMVQDNVTGLIWEVKDPQDADNTYSWYAANHTFIKALNDSKFGNLSDKFEWRLPTLSELIYLSDNSRVKPVMNKAFFPTAANETLWSSSQSPGDVNLAWSFDQTDGAGLNKGTSSTFKVRAVWGKTMISAFEDNKFGTVKDTVTGLMWQQATAKDTNGTAKEFSWKDAIEYCETLTLAGYTDWRLPNKNELVSLIDFQKNKPVISSDLFPDTQKANYWTSTNYITWADYAYQIDFSTGNIFYGTPTSQNQRWVRAVRGGNHLSKRDWYRDADKDGYGSENPLLVRSIFTNEQQPEGYVDNNADCDDNAKSVHPSANEIADDKTDQDCNGKDLVTWYLDIDNDGFGDQDNTITGTVDSPDEPYNHSLNYIVHDLNAVSGKFDCNDSNKSINPGMAEDLLDDGLDNDCNGQENLTWYEDADGDGYGAIKVEPTGEEKPEGAVANSQDCNDGEGNIHPGQVEDYNDGVDNNCNDKIDNMEQQIIPDTGQTTPYIEHTGDPREDSEFLINKPGYKKLAGDGIELAADAGLWATVKDTVTELVWEAKTNDNKDTLYSFEDAKKYCEDLVLAGYENWRLPTPLEMSYIANHNRIRPAINTDDTDFFKISTPATYWTFSPDSANPDIRLTMNFNYGVSYIESSSDNSVMAVREGVTPTAAFTDNGDETVTETRTGLMWQKSVAGTEKWSDAEKECQKKFGVYTDWRLPSGRDIQHLFTLEEKDRTDFFGSSDENFWTSQLSEEGTGEAAAVSFKSGTTTLLDVETSAHFRAVRGQIKPARYIDNNNDTIFDTKTGLMWQKETMHNINGLTWMEALNACRDLELASYTDWRLPNKNELLSLLDESRSNPSIDANTFPETQSLYWSSTSYADTDNPGFAWQLNFSDSSPRFKLGHYNNPVSVRAVRGGDIKAPE